MRPKNKITRTVAFDTPGALARMLRVPLHCVLYVLRTRAHIQPTATAGGIRVYSHAARELLREELLLIANRRRLRAPRKAAARAK